MTIRVVFDTNVLLSSLFSQTGPPFRCLVLVRTAAVVSITCQEILDEYVEKLVEKFDFDIGRATQAAQEVKAISEFVSVTGSLRAVDADPDDDAVVECALLGGAAYIITGDRHLINLEQYADIEIVRPARFVAMVDSPT